MKMIVTPLIAWACSVIFVNTGLFGQEISFRLSASVGVSTDTVFVHSGIAPYIVQRKIHVGSTRGGKVYIRDYNIFPMGDSASTQSISDTCLQLNDDSIVDVNFDGYKDLMLDLDSEEPVNMGQSSNVYPFNPATRKFEYSKTFSGFSELSVNPIDSTLRSQILFLGGTGEDYQTYKVSGNSLTLIQHEYRTGENYTKEILKDGRAVITEQYQVGKVAPSLASAGWMKLTHSMFEKGSLRPVEEWIALRLDDEPTPKQLKTGVVKELRWGKYLVRWQREISYMFKPRKPLQIKITVHEMKRGKWVTTRK